MSENLENTIKEETTESILKIGTVLNLKDIPIYSSAVSTRRTKTVSGVFSIYSNVINNGKIQIKESVMDTEEWEPLVVWITEADAIAATETKDVPTTEELAKPTPVKPATPKEATSFIKGDLARFNDSATKWATGGLIPNWVKEKTLYIRSTPVGGKCNVSTVRVGNITGIAYVKDLKKI